MRIWLFLLVVAVLTSATASASALGCRRGNRIGSSNGSTGINAIAPSRAVQNPCSTMYRFRGHPLRAPRRAGVPVRG